MQRKKTWLITAVAIVFVVAMVGAFWQMTRAAANTSSANNVQSVTKLDIELQNGHLVSPAATYIVKPGVRLDFTIKSNIAGEISVPTEPAQTVKFTESPLNFQFNAPRTAGTYKLGYRENTNEKGILIGTIVVRSE